jgi:dTMP kinase
MNPNSQPSGLFVTFEGVDGCGKTTQVRLLTEALSQRYLRTPTQVIGTKNPGGTALGVELRHLLLHKGSGSEAPLSTEAELLLYMADRAQHVAEVIRPTLQAGGIVLCDRFTDSTLAYQGYGRGLDKHWIETLNHSVCGDTLPHLTLFFDAPINVLMQRLSQDRLAGLDRMEQEGPVFLGKVKEGFHALATQHPQRIQVIDATASIEAIHQQVLEKVLARLA